MRRSSGVRCWPAGRLSDVSAEAHRVTGTGVEHAKHVRVPAVDESRGTAATATARPQSPQHFRPPTPCSPKYNRASRVPVRECRHAPLELLSPALHTSIPNKWTPYLASPYAMGYFPYTCRRMRSENREPGTPRQCRVERSVGPPARRRGTTLVETVRTKWMSSWNPDPRRSPHPVRVVPDRRSCT